MAQSSRVPKGAKRRLSGGRVIPAPPTPQASRDTQLGLFIHQGMRLRDALRFAAILGVEVEVPHANGELIFRVVGHPELGYAKVNRRVHSANRNLVVMLRRVQDSIRSGTEAAPTATRKAIREKL